MLVGLTVLALAFFVLPTRVHERYLFPLVALGRDPRRGLVAMADRLRPVRRSATFANMYVVLTTYYADNPRISDWLGIGPTLASFWPVAVASLTQAAVLGWAFLQLREEAVEDLAEDVVLAGRDATAVTARGLVRAAARRSRTSTTRRPIVRRRQSAGRRTRVAAGRRGSAAAGLPARRPAPAPRPRRGRRAAGRRRRRPVVPGVGRRSATRLGLGPWAWFRARLRTRPLRADRSRDAQRASAAAASTGSTLWVLAVLAISLLTVRMWRLDEPYQMHFDEVYHPRTATEFLQDWRYGLSHEIYEWTHPHLAKYAMAVGIMAFGEDQVGATSQLGVAVVDAVDRAAPGRRPRREPQVEGDRLWVATGSEVRAYDLATRAARRDARAARRRRARLRQARAARCSSGTRSGEIRVVDIDAARRTSGASTPVEVDSNAFMRVDGPIEQLYVTRDGGPARGGPRRRRARARGPGASPIVVIDADAATELGPAEPARRDPAHRGRSATGSSSATAAGVAFIDPDDGQRHRDARRRRRRSTASSAINDIEDDPIYASVHDPGRPDGRGRHRQERQGPARIDRTFTLPGATAGRAYFDHAVADGPHRGLRPGRATSGAGDDTIYVIEPHGERASTPTRALPYAPVGDRHGRQPGVPVDATGSSCWPSTPGGAVASVEIGRHAYAWRVPGVIAGRPHGRAHVRPRAAPVPAPLRSPCSSASSSSSTGCSSPRAGSA